jgi:transcriptional regulator with XRE-family HTH domain
MNLLQQANKLNRLILEKLFKMKKNHKITFGTYLRYCRIKHNMGLRKAAKWLDISPSYLCKIEKDNVSLPSLETLIRIMELYIITRSDIIENVNISIAKLYKKDELLKIVKQSHESIKACRAIAHTAKTKTNIERLQHNLSTIEDICLHTLDYAELPEEY